MSIRYLGSIQQVQDDKLLVAVQVDNGACSTCQVKSACEIGQKEQKVIEVFQERHEWAVGDQVWVCGKVKTQNKAVFWAYFLPFLLLTLTITVSFLCLQNDGITALLSLIVLFAYYTTLFFFKEKFRKSFNFTLEQYKA